MARPVETEDVDPQTQPAILEVTGLSKNFGGLAAVEDLDFSIGEGSITSMIGPNGAGKSSVFNLVSGIYRPTAGRIVFRGEDIAGLSPDRVQKKGIARTFQNQRLFANLSVLDNVLIGYHSRLKAGLFGDVLKPPWVRKEEKRAREECMEALALFGNRLVGNAGRRCIDLPYADRRLLELARGAVSRPSLLMLDEPSAGMNPSETVEFGGYVLKLRDRGITILLIEHNLSVVMNISEWIFVLDHGTKIAEGLPHDVRNDEKVIEAYLGRRATSA